MKEQKVFQYESAVNFIVVIVSWVMALILTAGFLIEYAKGNRSLSFLLFIVSTGLASVIAGTFLYIRNPLTRCMRYITFGGFYIMYVFTLLTATTDITFTFAFPCVTLFCMYIDRWFMSIVCSLVLLLNGVYVIQKLSTVSKAEIGEAAYNQFTTVILIHGFVMLLFMASVLAIVYVFYRLKRAMDHKVQEAKEARLTEQRLFLHATIDGLTGIFNRRHFLDKVQEQLDDSSLASSLLLLDIDDFKQVNDKHGHIAGDQVLIEFSNLLSSAFEGRGVVGRVGGEEFAVFLKGISERESQAAAEFLRETIGNCRISLNDEKQISITVSGGLAYSKRTNTTFNELYQHADLALYKSKNSGKNKITFDHAVLQS